MQIQVHDVLSKAVSCLISFHQKLKISRCRIKQNCCTIFLAILQFVYRVRKKKMRQELTKNTPHIYIISSLYFSNKQLSHP